MIPRQLNLQRFSQRNKIDVIGVCGNDVSLVSWDVSPPPPFSSPPQQPQPKVGETEHNLVGIGSKRLCE